MDVNWDIFKYEFCETIKNVESYDDFNDIVSSLPTNNLKGNYYEYFCKLYFVLIHNKTYSNFKLYNEIEQKLKNQLNLPIIDKGIDAIVNNSDNEIYAIQVKFRSDGFTIPFGEMATFQALTYGSNVKNIKKGIFFTNCVDVCDELKNDKYWCITRDNFDNCDKLFWNNVREYIGDKPLTKYIPLTPLPHQVHIIKKIDEYYNNDNYGRLILDCNVGKTFLGYWTYKNILKCDSVFIAVPSLYLLSATYESWQKELQYDDVNFILIGSDMDKKNGGVCKYILTTNKDDIKKELKKYKNKKIVVITTYHSSELLVNACKELKYEFGLGIFDEAHKTVGETNSQFTYLLSNGNNISKKRLFMTATEKIYSYKNSKLNTLEQKEKILSMDNIDIYGKVICKYSRRQAINDNVSVDYKLVASFITSSYYNNLINNNNYINIKIINNNYGMDIITNALMIIHSMDEYKFTHLLIFSNTNKKAKDIVDVIIILLEYIEMQKYEKILFKIPSNNTSTCMDIIKSYLGCDYTDLDKNKIYCKNLSGNDNMSVRKHEVKDFENAHRAIISSARIFGEGVNIKICDAVCFADSKSSTIDIVQYTGRPLRKYELKPNKNAYIIVPFVLNNEDDSFFDSDNKSFLKFRKILKSLGNIDEMITDNFVLQNCNKLSVANNTTSSESIVKIGEDIDINKYKENIISRVFDSNGNPEQRHRKILINENKRRYTNNQELIDTRNKCIKYLKESGIDNIPITTNWIKYCLGNDLFDIIKNKYYYTKEDLLQACIENDIYDCTTYKLLHNNDKKLPSFKYINNGFYYDMDNKFNLTILLENIDCDY